MSIQERIELKDAIAEAIKKKPREVAAFLLENEGYSKKEITLILHSQPGSGEFHNRFHAARVNEIDSHSSCLFAKSRSGTYPRFRLFALMPPGTYPRFLGSQGTYPPVFAH